MNTAVKKPLPPMVNIGIMPRKQMQALVDAMPKDRLRIEAGEMCVKVCIPKSGIELVSCALIAWLDQPNMWHVRAREGLISKTVTTV